MGNIQWEYVDHPDLNAIIKYVNAANLRLSTEIGWLLIDSKRKEKLIANLNQSKRLAYSNILLIKKQICEREKRKSHRLGCDIWFHTLSIMYRVTLRSLLLSILFWLIYCSSWSYELIFHCLIARSEYYFDCVCAFDVLNYSYWINSCFPPVVIYGPIIS